jgi:ribosome biogenesis GTPase
VSSNDDLRVLTPDLESLGWTKTLQRWADKKPGQPGRIARTSRGFSLVFTGGAAILAGSSSIRTETGTAPATGDYVRVTNDENGEPIIDEIAKRKTSLTRRAPGPVPEAQVLGANLDDVFVMHGLDRPVNLRRLERQLVIAWQSGARPFVLLTKADEVGHHEEAVQWIQQIAPGVETLAISTVSGRNIDRVSARFTGTRTIALIGLSGIGKSTLVNELSGGAVQRVGQVRATDKRGRHTTVTRDLIPLPGGGVVVDTPGIREVGLWQAHDGLAKTFPEIAEAASGCKFNDCAHGKEPECSVRAARLDGLISERRLDHWTQLSGELAVQDQQLAEFERRSESRDRVEAERKRDNERPRKKDKSSASRGGARAENTEDGRGAKTSRKGKNRDGKKLTRNNTRAER